MELATASGSATRAPHSRTIESNTARTGTGVDYLHQGALSGFPIKTGRTMESSEFELTIRFNADGGLGCTPIPSWTGSPESAVLGAVARHGGQVSIRCEVDHDCVWCFVSSSPLHWFLPLLIQPDKAQIFQKWSSAAPWLLDPEMLNEIKRQAVELDNQTQQGFCLVVAFPVLVTKSLGLPFFKRIAVEDGTATIVPRQLQE